MLIDAKSEVIPAWYALRVRSRSEENVAFALKSKQIEHFFPSWEERRIYSDRIRRTAVAAFPGYVFCRIGLDERVRVLSTNGVQHLVGAAGRPEAIDDQLIQSLRQAFCCTGRVSVTPYLRTGDPVRVLDGPMSGAVGVLLREKGHSRLVLSVQILQRSVAVEVDGARLMPLARP